MSIPPEITELVNRLNQELDETEQEATAGINLVSPLLFRFPDNIRFIQFFAFLNNTLLFVEISRKRIQTTVERIAAPDVLLWEIQEAGEDLGTLLGRLIETKTEVRKILEVLEEL